MEFMKDARHVSAIYLYYANNKVFLTTQRTKSKAIQNLMLCLLHIYVYTRL
jgi:hypothetical protein